MDQNPKIEIYLKKIEHNVKKAVQLCKDKGIEVAGVTKGFCAFPEIAQVMVDGGVKMLADSRISNIKKLQQFELPKMLIRIPMISELDDVVEYCDIVLISEIETARVLAQKSLKKGKVQKVIIMVDLGDLREGFWLDNTLEAAREINNIDGIKLGGIGTNLSCYGGVVPSTDNLNKLIYYVDELKEKYGINLEIISGGSTSSLHLLRSGTIPTKVNNLRIGEAMLLGREILFNRIIEDFYQDTFILRAEIVEIKEKPSIPIGEIGRDAFGNSPVFRDNGIRRRAIIAVGRQDVDPGSLTPEDDNTVVLGGSSDHIIIDITDSTRDYKIGGTMGFGLQYGGMLRLMTSPYVKKVIINE